MRIIKDPEVRKTEILDVSERLFTTKGYAQTTILEIMKEADISKGTFYYYFKSKEEVLDAIVLRIVRSDSAQAREIADDPNLPAIAKLFQILFAQKPQEGGIKDKMTEQFHQPSNAEMHQKSLVASVRHMSPVLARVVGQGVRENAMSTPYPREAVEFLLVSGQVIFDDGLFHWSPEELAKRMEAFISIMETTLGAQKSSFGAMTDVLKNREGLSR